MDYNTQREHLYFTEYGRGIQEMVKELLVEKDKEVRQKKAEAIVEIMAILNSHMKGVEDYKQKFWDHIYAMTNYEIDIESPYGVPERAVKQARPEPIPYPGGSKMKWNHLGKNLQELFDKAMVEEDEDKRKGYAQAIGNYMKVLYKNYHDETVSDEAIKEELAHISKGKLVYEANEFKKYVDGTLTESETVANIRNHKMNKNYFEQNKNQNRHKGNFRPKFGNSGPSNSNRTFKKR